MEERGYVVAASDLPAACVSAPHIRQRLYWMAYANGYRWREARGDNAAAGRDGVIGDSQLSRLADAGSDRFDDERRKSGEPSQTPKQSTERNQSEHGGQAGRLADMLEPGLERQSGHGDDRNESGRNGAVAVRSIAESGEPRGLGDAGCERNESVGEPRELGCAPKNKQGETQQRERLRHANSDPGSHDHWSRYDIIPCRDGKARRTPITKSDIILLVDGFWYKLAHVRAEFIAQTVDDIRSYAENCGTSAEQIMPMVQNAIVKAALDRAIGRQRGFPETQILQHFMRDILSALNKSTIDSGRIAEKGHETETRMLRDLRDTITLERSSLRRESDEQLGNKHADTLLKLSWFLARSSEAYANFAVRSNATNFPITNKVKGRTTLLRGYGNAIVPEAAAVFIQACEEARLEVDGL